MRRLLAVSAILAATIAALSFVWLRGRTDPGGLAGLIAVVDALPRRPITARVSASLAYKSPPAAMRGAAAGEAENWKLYAAVAALQEQTRHDRSAAALQAFGVASLLAGRTRQAAASLEEALRVETGERDLQDAIHASTNVALLTDLAASHYELGDDTDVHVAVEAAQRAWSLDRKPAIAWNRALAVGRMHVTEVTAAAWRDYLALDGRSEWADEARGRTSALERETLFAGWKRVEGTLLPLARRRDDVKVAAAATSFAQYARVYVEDSVLPSWARSELRGTRQEAEDQLHLATTIATALRTHSGDTTLGDAVGAIAATGGARRRLLAEAYAAFGEGRRLSREQHVVPAARLFADAERHARAAGGRPLADHAAYQRAACLFMQNQYVAGATLIAQVQESLARSPSRLSLNARVAYLRGLLMIQMGDPDGALRWYRDAIRLYGRAREHDSVALMSGRIADALDHVGEIDEASAVRMRALAFLDEVGEPARRDPILFDAADVALTRGWFATAQMLFAPIAEPAGQEPMWRCAALLARSSAFAAAEQHQAAVHDYTRARAACDDVPDVNVRERLLASAPILMTETADRRAQDITASIDFLNRTKNRIWLPEMYRRLGRIHGAAGDGGAAEAAYRRGIDMAQEIAGSVTNPLQRESFQRHVDALFSSLIGALVERQAFSEGLQYAERGRRRGFEQVDLERDVVAAGRSLRKDVAVVDLKWTPRSLAAWVITARGVVPFVTPLEGETFTAAVGRCRSNPACSDGDRRQLYELLVRPWIGEVRRCCATVVLVVDYDLDSIPFSALIDARTGQPLVRELAVATAPALDAVFRSAAAYAERAGLPEHVALVGPPAHDRERHPALMPLKGAESEVRFLHRFYAGSEMLTGAEATKEHFLAAARRSTLLQYSGHAIAAPLPDGSSALVLASGKTASSDDLLYVRDLYEANFARLRVAVLAACNTAGRSSRTRTGSASVARGFLASGVPVVIGTLWPVDDNVTNAFTRAFHRRLRAGKDPHAALRDAQLELMASTAPELRKPSSWAAFTACGAGGVSKGRENDDA